MAVPTFEGFVERTACGVGGTEGCVAYTETIKTSNWEVVRTNLGGTEAEMSSTRAVFAHDFTNRTAEEGLTVGRIGVTVHVGTQDRGLGVASIKFFAVHSL